MKSLSSNQIKHIFSVKKHYNTKKQHGGNKISMFSAIVIFVILMTQFHIYVDPKLIDEHTQLPFSKTIEEAAAKTVWGTDTWMKSCDPGIMYRSMGYTSSQERDLCEKVNQQFFFSIAAVLIAPISIILSSIGTSLVQLAFGKKSQSTDIQLIQSIDQHLSLHSDDIDIDEIRAMVKKVIELNKTSQQGIQNSAVLLLESSHSISQIDDEPFGIYPNFESDDDAFRNKHREKIDENTIIYDSDDNSNSTIFSLTQLPEKYQGGKKTKKHRKSKNRKTKKH